MSKKCTLLREADSDVKMHKTPKPSEVEMLKSAHHCGAKHVSKSKCTKHTSVLDPFWKLRSRKSARCCGAKHMSESKSTKHLSFGALLEVEMFKKCTVLWREAHLEVNILKTPHDMLGLFVDVETSFCVAGAREPAPSQRWAKRESFVACQKR